ncbi:MAG: hypothetical protein QOH17_1080 [Pseudonocardiales bacterium]|nr:hypothetical protein [Pseudonocardiales bacterium]
MAARSTKIVGVLVLVAAVAAGAVFGVRKLIDLAQTHYTFDHCTVGAYELDLDQAVVTAEMVGAVSKYRPALPEHAAVLVLAAGLQESKLRNLQPGEGDRDSVGVLQQRPSQGWGGGDAAKLNDVGEATKEFLDALVKVTGWQTKPLADAIQAVQVSADGSAYAQHEDEATALADAFQGHKPAAVTCEFGKPTVVASAAKVAAQVSAQLPVGTPTTSGGTISVPGAAWQTVAWFVANADRLGIDRVAYLDRVWSRADGWRAGQPNAPTVTATMAVLD